MRSYLGSKKLYRRINKNKDIKQDEKAILFITRFGYGSHYIYKLFEEAGIYRNTFFGPDRS